MRHLRGWVVWVLLAFCGFVLLGTMTGLTRSILKLERRRSFFEAQAELQERMRLALWRMDGMGTAWITDESQRPVVPASMTSDGTLPPGVVLPDEQRQELRLRFEIRDDDAVIASDSSMIFDLERVLHADTPDGSLFRSLSAAMTPIPAAWNSRPPSSEPAAPQTGGVDDTKRDTPAYQEAANKKEQAGRSRVVNLALNQSQQAENVANNWNGRSRVMSMSLNQGSEPGSLASNWSPIYRPWQLLQSGLPQPVVVKGHLFLLRHLQWRMPGGEMFRTIQGTWINAPALQARLLEEISDLFPNAKLVNTDPNTASKGHTLASFPCWQLDPGEIAAIDLNPHSLPLIMCWGAALLAIGTASFLVRGIMRLSDRRASFVSAVTHELRTPLTTFRLYSEMLESGVVKEEKRSDYLQILSREADRLAHLVENVLAFSRIERGSARTAVRETSVRDLLESLRERFESRLSIAGLELRMNLQGPSSETRLKIDAASVEHILFNLVDNAAKYAAAGTPPEITIRVVAKASSLIIYVEDNGPGISPARRDRIFQPFHKSARDAAESRPGVGLGLALSRRLARDIGGDLMYEQRQGKMGAIFILRLPLNE